MSKPGRGFFDDDDDEDDLALPQVPPQFQQQPESLGGRLDDSLDANSLNLRDQSPSLPPLPAQYQDSYERGSSVATGERTSYAGGAGRHSSVTGAVRGSSVRGAGTTSFGDSMRGDSPSLDDIVNGGAGRKRQGRNVQLLLQAWQNEMGAPELLKFPVAVVERIVKDLARRVRISARGR